MAPENVTCGTKRFCSLNYHLLGKLIKSSINIHIPWSQYTIRHTMKNGFLFTRLEKHALISVY